MEGGRITRRFYLPKVQRVGAVYVEHRLSLEYRLLVMVRKLLRKLLLRRPTDNKSNGRGGLFPPETLSSNPDSIEPRKCQLLTLSGGVYRNGYCLIW